MLNLITDFLRGKAKSKYLGNRELDEYLHFISRNVKNLYTYMGIDRNIWNMYRMRADPIDQEMLDIYEVIDETYKMDDLDQFYDELDLQYEQVKMSFLKESVLATNTLLNDDQSPLFVDSWKQEDLEAPSKIEPYFRNYGYSDALKIQILKSIQDDIVKHKNWLDIKMIGSDIEKWRT